MEWPRLDWSSSVESQFAAHITIAVPTWPATPSVRHSHPHPHPHPSPHPHLLAKAGATTCFNCQPLFAQHFPRAPGTATPLLSDRQNVELLFAAFLFLFLYFFFFFFLSFFPALLFAVCRQKAGCRCMINCPCGAANCI